MNQLTADGQEVTLIHYVYDRGNRDWRIACMPNMREFHQTLYHPSYQRTNDHRGVTCPQCLSSSILKGSAG